MQRTMLLLVCLLGCSIAGMAQDEAEHENWINASSTAVTSLFKNLDAKSGAAAASDAKKLQAIFNQVHAFWEKRKVADAMQFALDAQTNFGQAAQLASAGKFGEARAAVNKARSACDGCHSVHRERTPDGEWQMK